MTTLQLRGVWSLGFIRSGRQGICCGQNTVQGTCVRRRLAITGEIEDKQPQDARIPYSGEILANACLYSLVWMEDPSQKLQLLS